MRRICIITLVILCILSGCGSNADSGSSKSKKEISKGKESSSMSEGSQTDDENTELEEGTKGSDSLISKIKSLLGTTDISHKESAEATEEKEIIPNPDDAYKLNPMSGGSDAQALALRSKILSASDNLKITGTTYYVSSDGNDDNDGLSPERPLKTMGKVQSLSLNSGDGVLLKRGSIFRLTGTFSCKNGVTYGAYGEGNKPAIYGSSMNFAKSYFWSPSEDMKNVWKISFPFNGDVGIMVFNHGEHGSNRTDYIRLLEKNGDFYMDSTTGQLFLYCDKGNPGLHYYSIEIGTRMILFNLPSYNASNITIDNICFKYSGFFAIRSSINAKNITVSNCEIGWIGGAMQTDGLNVCGNGIEFLGGMQNALVKNCWIYQIFDSAITFQGRNDTKDYITAYKNIRFTENLLEYCGMSGIEWWTSTEPVEDTVMEDISFDNNIIRFTGYGWVKDAVRGARALQGPWSRNVFINMKNFKICDNILDCALGGMYSFPFDTAPDPAKHIMTGNTYYQKATPTNTLNRFGEYQYGSGQTDFENAVYLMEKTPKLIKWLG